MAATLAFHFDFISPFSYFAWQKVPALARKYERELILYPVDLAELKTRAGNTAPPTRMMPFKLKHLKEDQRRWARRYGVPISTPAHYDSTLLNKGAYFAIDKGVAPAYISFVYARVWGEGASMIDHAMIDNAATHCGLDTRELGAFIESPEVEARYRETTLRAHEAGVFGVPAMIADGQMFWGNDRLDFLEDHLAGRPV